jgi:hypothetical protein
MKKSHRSQFTFVHNFVSFHCLRRDWRAMVDDNHEQKCVFRSLSSSLFMVHSRKTMSKKVSLETVAQQLSSLTECAICMEVYTDPRSLPCLHTYCLECIKGFTRGNPPGADFACPQCRRKFRISEHGIQELPKNFLIQNLKHIQEASNRGGRAADGKYQVRKHHVKARQLQAHC